MPYTKPRDWVDGFDGGTPITAADLNRIEDGITATTVKAYESFLGAGSKFNTKPSTADAGSTPPSPAATSPRAVNGSPASRRISGLKPARTQAATKSSREWASSLWITAIHC